MRDYGRIYGAFWTSEDIQSLRDTSKLLAAYLLTCSHGTIAGVFHLPDGYVAEDLKWGQQTVTEGFHELSAKGFVRRCDTTKWVWVCKHLEWNEPENPNQWKAVRKMAARVPARCSWLTDFKRFIDPPANHSVTVPEAAPTVSKSVSVSEAVSEAVSVTEHRERATDPVEDGPGFERIKAGYPAFTGRADWLSTEHHCRLHLETGETWASLEAAAKRYAAYCTGVGKAGTNFVLSPVKFFSAADQPWKQPWALPPSPAALRERESLQKLVDRREAVGLADFRAPLDGETSDHYRQAQDVEWGARKRAPVPDIARNLAAAKRISP